MVHVGVEFEGFVVSVDMGDEPYTDDKVIAVARAEMIEQIKDAPDHFFTVEGDEDDE